MPDKTTWDPFLKYPYTKLRDLGFGPDIQRLPIGQANQVLAELAVAAINAGTTTTEEATSLQDLAHKRRKRRTEKAPT